MSVESGYKQTEIGKIPEGWVILRLGDAAEVFGGATPSTNVTDYWNGDIPFVTPTDVTNLKNGNILTSTEKSITKAGFKSISAKCVPTGSILLTSRATIGFCCINEIPVVTNQGFINLVCKDEFYNVYALYLIGSLKKKLERLSDGSTFKELTKRSFRKISIVLPPLAEQHKIASILSTVDGSIQKSDQIITKTQQLKIGFMQQLFTRGIAHKRFKQTELGEIPEEWHVKTIEQICFKPEYGYTQNASEKPIGPKFLRISDIQDGKVDWQKVPFCECPDNTIKKHLIQPGDIFVARTGATTGKSYLIKETPEAVFASYLIRIRAKKGIFPEFLIYFLNSSLYWKQVKQKMGGSAQGGFNASLLSKLLVLVPPPQEQQDLASILSTLDERIEIEMQRNEELHRLKKGLTNKLVTGQVRVKVT